PHLPRRREGLCLSTKSASSATFLLPFSPPCTSLKLTYWLVFPTSCTYFHFHLLIASTISIRIRHNKSISHFNRNFVHLIMIDPWGTRYTYTCWCTLIYNTSLNISCAKNT